MLRREFIRNSSLAFLSFLARPGLLAPAGRVLSNKPAALKPGSRIMLINPASAVFDDLDLIIAEETIEALGFIPVRAPHLLARHGYLAGTDSERAEDVNLAFGSSSVDAVFALRGGWGCARILDKLDYGLIAANPKILIGYSDITALLSAIYTRCGFPVFHGPVGISTWNAFTLKYFKSVLADGRAVEFCNPEGLPEGELVRKKDRIQVLREGHAEGVLFGGNLSVLASLAGTPYLPDMKGKILFLEDIGEDIYRIDRMMSQLYLSGDLKKAEGLVLGKFTDCGPGEGYASFTLTEVMKHYADAAGIPAYMGAMIGHIEDKFTVPVGVKVALNASGGCFRMLEPAVNLS